MKKQNANQNISGEETKIKNSPVQAATKPEAKPAKKGNAWKSVLVGGIPGIVFGVAGTLATEGVATAAPIPDEIETPSGSPSVYEAAPEATDVNDDMSFNDAFTAARAQVGAGGVFSWHGQVYSTYLKAEWDELNADQRHAYSQSVANANVHPDPYTDPSTGDDLNPVGPVVQDPPHEVDDPQGGDNPQDVDDPQGGDDVHIIGDSPEGGIDEGGIDIIDDGTIDNQDTPFIDVDSEGHVILDSDGVDSGASDMPDYTNDAVDTEGHDILNPDGVDFGAPDDNLYADTDMPDYTNDADVSSLI